MTKTIQEISLSFLFLTCAVAIILAMTWIWPVIESQRLLIDETRANQSQVLQGVEDSKAIVIELSYVAAVVTMLNSDIIRPVEANQFIEQSVDTIAAHSERLGKLARLLNEYRINNRR